MFFCGRKNVFVAALLVLLLIPVEPPKAVANSSNWQPRKFSADSAALRGNMADAEAKYQSAISSAESAKDNGGTLTCVTALANCLAAQPSKLADEEALRQKAVELAGKGFGATSPQYALALAGLADYQARKGETGAAEETSDRAMKILGQSEDKFPLEMAACYVAIAERQIATRTPGLADDSYKKALELRSAKLPAGDPAVIDTLRRYADLLTSLGRKDEAKKLQERITLARAEAPGDATPAVKVVKGKDPFANLVAAAKEATKSGDKDKALAAWKAVLQEAEKANTKDGRLAYAMVHVADCYRWQNNNDEALALYKRAIEVREKQDATKTLGMMRNLNRVAQLEMAKKNYAEADRLYVRAVDLADSLNAPDPLIAITLQNMLSACGMAQDNLHSEQAARRLITLSDKTGGPMGQMQKSMATAMLGSLYMKSGKLNEGMQLMKSMASMPRPNPADYASMIKDSYNNEDGLYDKAEEPAFMTQ